MLLLLLLLLLMMKTLGPHPGLEDRYSETGPNWFESGLDLMKPLRTI